MIYTDDSPKQLNIEPRYVSHGPLMLSNHSKMGFNIRHLYLDWQTGELKPSKRGVSINPNDAMELILELVEFVNATEIYPKQTIRVEAIDKE
jgi:hypothetical protein